MGNIRELVELDKKHFLHPTSSIKQQQANGPSFIFTKGRGIYLEDVKGTIVIDGMSSLWNVNVGHGRTALAEAAKQQMEKLAYSSCFATFSNEPAIRLAAKLAELSPGTLRTTFFTSGGSEANDTAYKLARHLWILRGKPEKRKIIARTKSYHGVSMGATSATGLKPFRDFTSSLAPDFIHVDHFNATTLREIIEKEGPKTVAAYIAEPVQGAGGVHVAPAAYFKEVKAICSEYDILFITDEVITGFGRTGKWFGMEHYDVTPDMMCFAKGITSGYTQLGGVMLTKEIHDELLTLSNGTLLHGYTYSGHATSCAVALENLKIVEKENLVSNAKTMGNLLLIGLSKIQRQCNVVKEVRGLGLMAALDFNHSGQYQTPLSPKIVDEAAKRGLICRSVLFDEQDTIVIAPPLIITRKEIEKVLTILEEAIISVVEN